MSFIQIIEYETDRPDEMRALGEARMAQARVPIPNWDTIMEYA